MEYFWKENKKYLVALGAALLFALIYHWFVLGPVRKQADAVANKRQKEEKALRSRVEKGVPDEDTIGLAKAEIKRTQDLLESLSKDMSFKEPDRFRNKPEGQTWVEHWNAEKMDVDRELQGVVRGMNAPKNFVPPSLGGTEEITEDLARELLLRLAVVDRLVRLAADSKVDRIDAVDLLPVAHAGMRKDEPVTKKGMFLNKYTVHMAFKGDQQSVFKVFHGVQKKGTFLAVERFDVDRTDSTKDYLNANLRVSLLRIDEKAPIEVKEERGQ